MPHLHENNTILIVSYTIFMEKSSDCQYNIYTADERRLMFAIW